MILFLIGLFFSIMLLTSFVTYLIYWYEEGSRPYGPHPGVCTRAACIIRGLAMSFISLVAVFGSYPLGLINWNGIPKRVRNATPANPPILFIHGLYHNSSAWLLYHAWFRKAGLKNTYSFSYLSFQTSFDYLVERLEKKMQTLEKACPDNKPILIGHSLGGLVIRAWMARDNNQQRLAGVITLGTPHQGSKLAGLGAGSLCRSIIFRGPLIRSIEEHDIRPSIPCCSLSSPLDNMVLPQEGLHIRNTAWQEERTPLVSHIAMLYHKETATQVIEVVRTIIDDQLEAKNVLTHDDETERDETHPTIASPTEWTSVD